MINTSASTTAGVQNRNAAFDSPRCNPLFFLELFAISTPFFMNKAALTDSLIRYFLFQIIESSIRSL